jgi:competence ComEA-like helix-hairpin-helix protein
MKKLLLAFVAFVMSIGMAFAAVDINSADEAGLDAIKGVGSVKAKALIEERKKNGPFKSLDDVAVRVKGIGEKTVAGWKKDGSVSIGGGGAAPVAAKAEAKKDAPKAEVKKDAPKAEEKKADAKKEAPKAEEKKADAKKADAKKDAPKADDKKDAPKADAKK